MDCMRFSSFRNNNRKQLIMINKLNRRKNTNDVNTTQTRPREYITILASTKVLVGTHSTTASRTGLASAKPPASERGD
ncbi:hypothetical protein PUN28_008210 [Cardiocondyla obscurior]|uniref:Uncharacterized protein n=1 Tax=Cardiocondyla obscurior TaxID=286306 RepID=A0AAW2FYS5_9HYME